VDSGEVLIENNFEECDGSLL